MTEDISLSYHYTDEELRSVFNEAEYIRISECMDNFTPKDCKMNEDAAFWSLILEGYLSLVVVGVGFLGNVTSIWVLCDSSFTDTFNKLLISLSVFDTMFLCKNVISNYL